LNAGISISDLSNAADAIAETSRGISGPKIVTYSNHFAGKHNVRIPHASYPFGHSVGNKRTALLENLRAFPSEIQYALLLQLCDDKSIAQNENVKATRQLLLSRYPQFADPSGISQVRPPPTLPMVPDPAPISSPPPTELKPQRPYDIFLSYSHEDEELMTLVRKHLVVYDRQGLIRKWWDRKLTGGKEVDRSIRQELATSDIILLFVSAHFLASDYCYDVEMKQALKQHAEGRSVVVPVILRSCGWRAAPIGSLLALPRDGRPLTLWPDRDEAANNVADGVMRIVADLHSKAAG
jgi:hypothetical protein